MASRVAASSPIPRFANARQSSMRLAPPKRRRSAASTASRASSMLAVLEPRRSRARYAFASYVVSPSAVSWPIIAATVAIPAHGAVRLSSCRRAASVPRPIAGGVKGWQCGVEPPVEPVTPPTRSPRGIRASAGRVLAHATALARLERELARTELERKAATVGAGSATGLAAAVLTFYAVGLGLALVTALLALVVDVWLALLIVLVVVLLGVVVLALVSRELFRAGAPLRPEQALEEARLTKQALQGPRDA